MLLPPWLHDHSPLGCSLDTVTPIREVSDKLQDHVVVRGSRFLGDRPDRASRLALLGEDAIAEHFAAGVSTSTGSG
ncbi:hypothetical protein GCM10025792_13320 [Pseudonocardia tropica]